MTDVVLLIHLLTPELTRQLDRSPFPDDPVSLYFGDASMSQGPTEAGD